MRPRSTLVMLCAASALFACARHQTNESTGEVAPAPGTDSAAVHRDSVMNRTRDDTLHMQRDTTMRRDTTMNRDTTTYRDTTMKRDTTMQMHRDTTMTRDTTGQTRDTTMRRDTT